MTELPPPPEPGVGVAERVRLLEAQVGRDRFVEVCVDLLEGADRTAYVPELRYLTNHHWADDDPIRDRDAWKDYWVRTWGARGLLHVWDERATLAVVAGLGDEHYRPAEMCLKVAARHDVAGAGPGAVALLSHELPRVRAAALRALAVVGDTEHASAVHDALDDPDASVRAAAGRAWERLVTRLDLDPE